ncbi:N-acetylglucosamine repressor [Planctomycetes bacterium Pan216]|uniref:N-acetylglucosamine repressor n=1 Tax=Kolteria novifilia TaxID=2527975 RepID=A0A518AWZ7_9BACT|nr:N-acetylglucosamine repressor [Planctomycetes bacterium Pan216]
MPRAIAKARPSLLRQMNEQRVLEAVAQHGPVSRAEVTRFTGISAPTVSKTVAALIEANLLEEGEFQRSGMGRPGKTLRMATKGVRVLALEVGIRDCFLSSAGLDGRFHSNEPQVLKTPKRYEKLTEMIAEAVTTATKASSIPVLGLGISIPGLLDEREQRTLTSPNLHQTDGRQLGKDVEALTGLTTILVQESHALCLAEQMEGQARDLHDYAVIDIADGLGLGAIVNGHPLWGHRGIAGELGHVTVNTSSDAVKCGCGNIGCLETEATDAALARRVSQKLGRELSIEETIDAIQSGEVKAKREIDRLIDYLGIGLAAVINLLNPQAIFLHGRLFDAADGMFDRLIEVTRKRALAPSRQDCDVFQARGTKIHGALSAIIRHVTSRRDVS